MLRSGAALRRSGFWHVTVDLMLSWLFHGNSSQKEEEGTNKKKKGGTKDNLSAACPPRDISILTAHPVHSHNDGRCCVFCFLIVHGNAEIHYTPSFLHPEDKGEIGWGNMAFAYKTVAPPVLCCGRWCVPSRSIGICWRGACWD